MDRLVNPAVVGGHPPPGNVLAEIRRDFEAVVAEIPSVDRAPPFSRHAYNAVSANIHRHCLDAIEACADLGAQPHQNLAIISFCELLQLLCKSHFAAHEQKNGFEDPFPPREVRTRPRRPVLSRVATRARTDVRRAVARLRRTRKVGYAGNTTIPWVDIDVELWPYGLSLEPVRPVAPLAIPAATAQKAAIQRSLAPLEAGLVPTATRRDILGLLDELISTPAQWHMEADLLVTGTLGGRASRLAAFHARSREIPVLVIHHGGHHLAFDEPYYDLYEGRLADGKVGYGDIEHQLRTGCAGPRTNMWNSEIRMFGRTDRDVALRLAPGLPGAVGSLEGKVAAYLAVEFETGRYGPFRDVHPATYARWQQRLLEWLARTTGRPPIVRLHPKRPTPRYDPPEFPDSGRTWDEDVALADFVVIDYPTTSLAHAAASGLPILFFDIGLRRLNPAARRAIYARCHAAACEIEHPETGFKAMQADLSRAPAAGFEKHYRSPVAEDEARSIALAVMRMVRKV